MGLALPAGSGKLYEIFEFVNATLRLDVFGGEHSHSIRILAAKENELVFDPGLFSVSVRSLMYCIQMGRAMRVLSSVPLACRCVGTLGWLHTESEHSEEFSAPVPDALGRWGA